MLTDANCPTRTRPAKNSGFDGSWVCKDHQEKLRLFCLKDQRLACLVCRDSKGHKGHKFIPTSEAAAPLRKKLKTFAKTIDEDIQVTEHMAFRQMEEISRTVDRAHHLRVQMGRQFKEMHLFLRMKEDEIKTQLKVQEEQAVEDMARTLIALEAATSEGRVLEAKVTSILDIADTEKFLRTWTENNGMLTQDLVFKPRAKELQVTSKSVSLGPYESHLQFFMWKEMLQVIKPRAEPLMLQTGSKDGAVSHDGRSLWTGPKVGPLPDLTLLDYNTVDRYGTSRAHVKTCPSMEDINISAGSGSVRATSINEFSSGQVYWEVDVGPRSFWDLGVQDYFLRCDGFRYSCSSLRSSTDLSFTGRPRRIGVYLDFCSKTLSFYNADNMRHLHTLTCKVLPSPLKAYLSIKTGTTDQNPVAVCWY